MSSLVRRHAGRMQQTYKGQRRAVVADDIGKGDRTWTWRADGRWGRPVDTKDPSNPARPRLVECLGK